MLVEECLASSCQTLLKWEEATEGERGLSGAESYWGWSCRNGTGRGYEGERGLSGRWELLGLELMLFVGGLYGSHQIMRLALKFCYLPRCCPQANKNTHSKICWQNSLMERNIDFAVPSICCWLKSFLSTLICEYHRSHCTSLHLNLEFGDPNLLFAFFNSFFA